MQLVPTVVQRELFVCSPDCDSLRKPFFFTCRYFGTTNISTTESQQPRHPHRNAKHATNLHANKPLQIHRPPTTTITSALRERKLQEFREARRFCRPVFSEECDGGGVGRLAPDWWTRGVTRSGVRNAPFLGSFQKGGGAANGAERRAESRAAKGGAPP